MSPTPIEMPAPRFAEDASEVGTQLTAPQRERRRALVIPREHGAWGMLLIPLATGAGVALLAGGRLVPILLLTATVLTLFWLRTPVESLLGTGAVRIQNRQERKLVSGVIFPLAAVSAVCLGALFGQGQNRELIWPGAIAAAAFALQMLLKRIGRATRMGAEIAGAIALTSTAPAAYCVAMGRLDARAWTLWLVNWLFAADQIHFVWLRMRGVRASGFREKLIAGWSFLAGNIILGGVLLLACHFHWLPALPLVAFIPILLRGFLWFAAKPRPIVVRRLGWTELAHSMVFAVLLTASLSFVR